MKKLYFKFRIFLFMLALGLAAVPFSKSLYEKFSEVAVDLPQTSSGSPLMIDLKYRSEIDYGGGSGPDAVGNTEVINTLGSSIRPHMIENAELQKAMLQKVDFSAAHITSSNFSKANLKEASFFSAVVLYSSFIKSNLRSADFSGAKVYGSDCSDADFSNAKFASANMARTGFHNAVLTNADLTDANLSHAELETARGLSYEQLSRALINEYTTLPAKWESKRAVLVARSRQRLIELRNEKSAEELELLTNPYDFLD